MKLLEYTSQEPAENLAIDEALLEAAESENDHPEVFRLWEPEQTMVVLGRSSPIKKEANQEFCTENGIPIFRRCSGGQTIVTGPGCLMYAVLLDYHKRPQLRMLEKAHQFVMSRLQTAINRLGINTEMKGTCDLTYQNRKFSGNALRCKRKFLIYHGTLLCDFDLTLIPKCLGQPIRQPEYRNDRTHEEFIASLPFSTDQLRNALIQEWNATEKLESMPKQLTRELTKKYLSEAWTVKV